MTSNESRLLRDQLRILSKIHSWEILSHITKGAKYITQISRETNLPYTTVQHRVQEMERAELVTIRNEKDEKTGKAVKLVRASHFKLILEPNVFAEIVKKEKGVPV
jgi:predicted transcriptional regulator